MNSLSILFVLASSFTARTALATQTPPQEKSAEKQQTPPVYDEQANAKQQIADALARAKKENRRVLVQWGANWCPWCIKLHGTFKKDSGIANKLSYEYDVVLVDIGKWDKNLDLAAQYGADLKSNGVPYLTVLDGEGKVLANQDTGSLENGDAHDPKKVLDFLTQHQAKYWVAEDVLAAGKARAKQENKRVFLHFGAPWCPWCHKLEDWMAQPAIAAALAKDFVDVKIDQDRMVGGKELLTRVRASDQGGIPWFVFLDADGKALVTSDGPKGNVGFPAEDFETAHFVSMLEKVRVNLTPADIESLRASLAVEREKIYAARERAKAQPAAGGAQ